MSAALQLPHQNQRDVMKYFIFYMDDQREECVNEMLLRTCDIIPYLQHNNNNNKMCK